MARDMSYAAQKKRGETTRLQKMEKKVRSVKKKCSQTWYKDCLIMAIKRSKNEGRDYPPNSRR